MTVKVQDLPALHVAYVANLEGYSEEKIGRAWAALCRWASARNLLGLDATLLGMSFDNPDVTPANRCRYYACVKVPPDTQTGGEIGVMDIPGGRHAIYDFRGRMSDIKGAYKEFYGIWLPSSGFQPADRPSYEIYRTTPGSRPDSVFEMDICMPIEPLR